MSNEDVEDSYRALSDSGSNIKNSSSSFSCKKSEKKPSLQSFEIGQNNITSQDTISYTHACCDIYRLSFPSIIGMACESSLKIINIIFVGHLNDSIILAGVGLANITISLVCFSVSFGFNGAIDTLVSQAYGNQEYYLCGAYLNRGRIMQSILFIFQALILYNCKWFLITFGQDEQTAEVAQTYNRYILIGLFFQVQFDTVRRFLQAMGIFRLPMLIFFITIPIHLMLNYLFIYKLKIGFIGSVYSSLTVFSIQFLSLNLYITFNPDIVPKGSWHFFNKDSFKNWFEYVKYAFPSAFLTCIDWWSFCICGLFAGTIGVVELASNIILGNLVSIFYAIGNGMSFAVNSLVGKSLGENLPNKAKRYSYSSGFCCSSICVIIMTILIIFSDKVPLLYTKEQSVIDTVSHIMPVFSLMILLDSFQGVMIGVIKGCGLQIYGTILSVSSFWGIMLPCCYLLVFVFNCGLIGIWIGIPIGLLSLCIMFIILVVRIQWVELAQKVVNRVIKERQALEIKDDKLI